MKKIIITTIAAGVTAIAGASVDVTMDFASAYVFRGVTFNDGFVFQPGIEAGGLGLPEAYGSVAVGAWANFDIDDYGETLQSSQFSEVDWYASYSLPTLVDGLDLFVGYCEYTYPLSGDATTPPSPADKEMSIGAGYEIVGIGLGLTYYQGIGGAINGSSYTELVAGYGYDFTDELSASVDGTIGFASIDGGESGLNDYTLGATVSYALGEVWGVGLTGTYIGQGDDAVLSDDAYDVSFVGLLSLSASM